MAHPLSDVVNRCFLEGFFPKELKRAIVVPVSKGYETDECSGYNFHFASVLQGDGGGHKEQTGPLFREGAFSVMSSMATGNADLLRRHFCVWLGGGGVVARALELS